MFVLSYYVGLVPPMTTFQFSGSTELESLPLTKIISHFIWPSYFFTQPGMRDFKNTLSDLLSWIE
jgi:hypothetical protein